MLWWCDAVKEEEEKRATWLKNLLRIWNGGSYGGGLFGFYILPAPTLLASTNDLLFNIGKW